MRKEEKIKLEICSIEIVIEIVGKKKKKARTISGYPPTMLIGSIQPSPTAIPRSGIKILPVGTT